MEEQSQKLAQDLLDSIFRVATELVRGERASLMLRDDDDSDFVISRAVGMAADVQRQVRVHVGEGIAGKVAADRRAVLAASGTEVMTHRGAYKTRSYVSVPIVVKQHPETAKGHVFLSLEDEAGIANVIVRPATYRACKAVIDTSPAVVVEGVLQHVDGVVSVLARRLEPVHLFIRPTAREWR